MSVSSSTIKGATWILVWLRKIGRYGHRMSSSHDFLKGCQKPIDTSNASKLQSYQLSLVTCPLKTRWVQGLQAFVFLWEAGSSISMSHESIFQGWENGLNFQPESILQSWYLRKVQKTHEKMWQGLPSCLKFSITLPQELSEFSPRSLSCYIESSLKDIRYRYIIISNLCFWYMLGWGVQSYFQYYAKLANQQNMLQDGVRTSTYNRAIVG